MKIEELQQTIERRYSDFNLLNTLTPHPIYAWIYWAFTLNPTSAQLKILSELLDENMEIMQRGYVKKINFSAKTDPIQ